jgi:hypothetical protein
MILVDYLPYQRYSGHILITPGYGVPMVSINTDIVQWNVFASALVMNRESLRYIAFEIDRFQTELFLFDEVIRTTLMNKKAGIPVLPSHFHLHAPS